MEPWTRLVGPSAEQLDEGGVRLDLGGFIRRLILFDAYILESHRLKEFPQLARVLGYDGLKELLDCGLLRVQCEAITIAQTGQATVLESRERKGALPLRSYSFNVVKVPDQKDYIHRCLLEIAVDWNLPDKQVIKLKKSLTGRLLPPPPEAGEKALRQLDADLRRNTPGVAESVTVALRQLTGLRATPTDFSIQIEAIDNEDFRVESGLGARFGLDDLIEHRVIERGLLAVGGLNQRVEQMERHAAMTGFRDGERSLFANKLAFLARQLDPEIHEQRFERVVTIAGLPEPDSSLRPGGIDGKRLVEVLQSDECHDFRRWLRSVDSVTDAEIRDHLGGFHEKLSGAVRSKPGKAVRFLATTGIGAIPVIGAAAGPIAGALDTFLVERVIGDPGPTAFLSQLYPSVFRRPDVFGAAGP